MSGNIPTSLMAARQRMGERNDCTVIALAVACGVTYEEAHAALKKHGRRDRKGAWHFNWNPALAEFGRKLERVTTPWTRKAKTCITLERALPSRGIFWAFTTKRAHVMACRAGQILDWSVNTRHRIQEIYRVVPL